MRGGGAGDPGAGIFGARPTAAECGHDARAFVKPSRQAQEIHCAGMAKVNRP